MKQRRFSHLKAARLFLPAASLGLSGAVSCPVTTLGLALPLGLATFSGCALAADEKATPAIETFPLDGGVLTGARAQTTERGLQVDFGNREAWPNITWKAGEKSWDWSRHEALVLTLENPGTEPVSFHVKINDVGTDGKGNAVQLSGMAAAGKTERFYVSLLPRSVRSRSGMRVLPPLSAEYGTLIGTGIEPNNVRALQIFRSNPKETATLVISSITIEGPAPQVNLDALVDKYGQYTRADWPGKVKTDTDLATQKDAEAKLVPPTGTNGKLSQWGGFTDAPRQKATGFFGTAQVNGRWWLVDPDGYLFLSTGIDVVRPVGATIVENRESMFSWLPAAGDPLEAYFGRENNRKTYNFLQANLHRKYGKLDDEAFAALSARRMKSWGFNTFGNWTPETYGQTARYPYAANVGIRGNYATVPGHRGHKMPDPFDPAFAAAVDTQIAAKAQVVKNDPACMGYFVDNELPWGMPKIDDEHFVLARGAMNLDAKAPAKAAFLELLRGKYTTVEALNKAWNTQYASWDVLSAPVNLPGTARTAAQRQDFADYLTLFADRYFQTVSSAIKKHAPNHMYLGSRFAYWFTEEAVRSCAKYADVLSFNIYGWNPATYQFTRELGKPSLVGEFHYGATDRGMFTGNVNVKTQAERGASYAAFVKAMLSEPNWVGCHWFQLYDQPTTGRAQDGENFNIGFLSITDTPYMELITAAREANSHTYRWHTGQ